MTALTIGIIASVCTGISLFPQLLKIIKEKKSTDISYPMLLILLTGLICWTWYGIRKTDWIIIISNAVSLLINLAILYFNTRYRNRTNVTP